MSATPPDVAGACARNAILSSPKVTGSERKALDMVMVLEWGAARLTYI